MHQFPAVMAMGRVQVFLAQGVEGALHGVEGFGLAGQHGGFEQGMEGFGQRGGRPRAAGCPHPQGRRVCSGRIPSRRVLQVRHRQAHHRQVGHRHAVPGQRAGLVRAQHRGRAQRLDGSRPSRQHAFVRQAPRAHGHEHREDERELFGQQRHGQRHPAQQRGQPVPPCEPEGQDEQQAGCRAGHGGQAHQPARLQRQGRVRGLDAAQRAPYAPHGAGRAGGGDLCDPLALDHDRAGPDEGLSVTARLGAGGPRCRFRCRPRAGRFNGTFVLRCLAHRYGLARQQRLVSLQGVGRLQHAVRGHTVALTDQQQIAPHHLAAGNAQALAASQHQGPGAGQVSQGFQHAFGALLLHH